MNDSTRKILGILVALFFGAAACVGLEYEEDLLVMGSAAAGSPEFPVTVNGKLCRDNDGLPGFCAVRHQRGADFEVRVETLQYDATVEWDCTRAVQPFTETYTVRKGDPAKKLTVGKEMFGLSRVFSCTVKVLPLDRPEPIASFARISVSLVDEKYIALPRPYPSGRGFVFGSNAHYVKYKDAAGWHEGKKLTAVKSETVSMAFVESYGARHAVYVR